VMRWWRACSRRRQHCECEGGELSEGGVRGEI